MAKKRTIVEETIPDTPPTEEIPHFSAWDKIKVYKIIPGHMQPVFCFTSNVDIDEEILQSSSYGGGKYEVHYCGGSASEIIQTMHYEIAEKPQPSTPQTAESIQIQMLRDQAQMNRELLLAVLGRSNPTVGSTPMGELATMWGIMQGSGMGGANPQTTMMDIFIKGLEMGAGKAGDMDWKTALIQTAKEVIQPVAQIVAASKNGGNGATPVMSPVPAPTTPPTQDAIIKAGLQYLKPRIRAGWSVETILDIVIGSANDPQYEPIITFAMSKTIDDLIVIDPEIANEPYKSWFTTMIKGLRDHFEHMNEESDHE